MDFVAEWTDPTPEEPREEEPEPSRDTMTEHWTTLPKIRPSTTFLRRRFDNVVGFRRGWFKS